MKRYVGLLLFTLACGCNSSLPNKDATTVTLYRNSPLSIGDRVHWATFDAADGSDYNRGNCQMAARILNSNFAASVKAEGKQPFHGVGFWCEIGRYSETGGVPVTFDAEFPSDTRSPMRFSQ